MATAKSSSNLLLLLLLFMTLSACFMQGFATEVLLTPIHSSITESSSTSASTTTTTDTDTFTTLRELGGSQEVWKKKRRRRNNNVIRRMLIGSTAPTCTYNECRGCKFKCKAEQIPVDANDPINSAYHYRCVCHR